MPSNPPNGFPRVSPYLLYEDLPAALAWLSAAFGFETRTVMPGPSGDPQHAEMTLGDGLVMLGQPGGEYRSPKALGASCQMLYIYVDDVDGHHARAREHGAEILEPPTDVFYGDRRYTAADPEGHRWVFATHVRDVPPEEMKPT